MRSFGGPVFRHGDDGYDSERSGFNLSVEHRPELVVGATGPDDVIAAVRLAAERGLPVGVMTTGHGPAVAADGAVLINTRRMDEVRIDPAAGTAWTAGGVRWKQVLPLAGEHGLAPLNGTSPTVGVAGYTLGGGVGPLGRQFGFAADRVRRIELVTADGRLREVTAESEPELFWAVRGGKDNFGIVVGLEFELVPVSRIYGGGLFFAGESAADVLHAYRQWAPGLPEEMSSSVLLIDFGRIPQAPPPFAGKYIANVRITYNGPAEEGERLVRPLREAATPILDTLRELPYAEVGTVFNDPTDPIAAYDSAANLRELDDKAVDTLLGEVGPGTGSPLIVEVRQLGGAFARPPAVPSAVGGRDTAYTLFATCPVRPGEVDAAREVHDRLQEAMRPWATGSLTYNFCGSRDAAPERVKLAFTPADYARLAKAKATYDPTNMFRVNLNIPPAA